MDGLDGEKAREGSLERPEFRRTLLATLFLSAQAPLTTSQIVSQVYNNPVILELGKPELSAESAAKALKRDIDALKQAGIVIESAGKADDGQTLWQVNRPLTFTQGIALSEEDAAFLDIACLPLLNDPGFAERDELRLALAKIDRLFDAAATEALTASSARDSAALVAVREAYNARCAADIYYRAHEGLPAKRRIAPLAFFDLRSTLYVVGARYLEDGSLDDKNLRTYRMDRIESASPVPSVRFEVPEGFDVNEFRKLPFQIGAESVACTFFVPERLAEALRAASYGKGRFEDAEAGSLWHVDAANLDDAAAWAIAYGIAPVSPAELVSCWRTRLEEASRG